MRQVLVIDDDLGTVNLCAIFLRDLGIQSEGFDSGEKAMEAFIAKDFDAVLIDYALPRIMGVDLAAMFQAKKPTPLYIMSGFNRQGIEQEMLSKGVVFNDYLEKSKLESEIRRVFGE